MNKKLAFGFLMLAILFACNTGDKTGRGENKDQIPEVTLSELMENTEKYVDKSIMVSGIIDHVCRETGKKMFLVDPESEERIKITVGKNIPTFDVELEGSELRVTGIFQELIIDEDYLAKWEEELTSKHDTMEEVHAQTQYGEMADQGLHVGDMQQISSYRKQLEDSGKDHIAFYSIECSEFTRK
jgi:hypothetical protein